PFDLPASIFAFTSAPLAISRYERWLIGRVLAT
ncbi:uncharacterized protein METZ01_LOCUS486688, partial [marine metagenome]